MKPVSRDQSNELGARFLTDTRWGEIDHDALQQNVITLPRDELGRRFTAFMRNNCQFIIKGPRALVVDRAKLPTPAQFVGKGVSIWLGSKDGDGLAGEPDEDPRSVALTVVDFAEAQFVHCLAEDEKLITGEEKLERMKALPNIRYDFGVGVALHQEKGQATLRFLHDVYGITWFELAGTVLRDSGGYRYFLYLGRRVVGSWGWNYGWLGSFRSRAFISPVSAS